MNYDLVIFDCDGVLVDSERITSRVFCDMLAELGLELTQEEMFQRFVGQAMDRCLVIIEDALGRPAPDNFVPDLRARPAAGACLRGIGWRTHEDAAHPGQDGALVSLRGPDFQRRGC